MPFVFAAATVLFLSSAGVLRAQEAKSEAQPAQQGVEALREKAQGLIEEGEFAKAADTWMQLLEQTEEPTAEDFGVAGRLLVAAEKPKEAVKVLKRGVKQFPDQIPLTIELGFAHNANEQFEPAYKAFQKAESEAEKHGFGPLNDAFYFPYGVAAERSGKNEEADRLFQRAIEAALQIDPQRAAAPLNYLGYMWLEQDRNLDEAGALIVQAVNLDPESGAYQDSLGWFHFKQGNYKAALTELMRAVDMLDAEGNPDAVVYDHVAQTHAALENYEKAVEFAEKAVELDGETGEFSERLEEYRAKASE